MNNNSLWQELLFHDHKDLRDIQKEQKLPDFVVDSLLDSSEISHLRNYNDVYYLVVSFPTNKISHRQTQENLHTIAIVITKKQMIFLHRDNIDLTPFFKHLHAKNIIEVLYEFLAYIFSVLEKKMNIIRDELSEIEHRVIISPDNDEFKKLFHIQKVIIHFQTAITGLIETLQTIPVDEHNILWNKNYMNYLNDIKIESNQIDKTVNMLSDTVSSLLDTAGSIQSNNLSKRMKTLTSITIVISIPTLITGFYGMNIDLPFQDHPYSLLIVSVASFLITLAITIYLYKKNLF